MQEEMKRNADKEAAIQYQKYLEELMVKEVKPTSIHYPCTLISTHIHTNIHTL